VTVVGGGQALFQPLGQPAHVALDLAADRIQLHRSGALDGLDPAVQVLGDAQDLAAHGLDGLGRTLFGRLDLVADGQDGALDAVHPAFGFGGVEPPHHLGAVALDLTAEGLGQLFETGRLADAFRLDPALGGAQPLVQSGERTLQPAQGLGRARLGLIQPLTDLVQQVGADARTRGLFDRVHALTQFVDAGTLTLLDVVQTTRDGPHGRLDLAEGLGRLRADLLLEPAQAAVALAQFLGDIVDTAGVGLVALVLAIQPAHQSGHGLIDALDGDGRAALSSFQPGGDGVDRGAQTAQLIVVSAVDIVHPAAAAAALEAVGGVRTAGQRNDAFVLVAVFHNDGVQPLAQRHAGTTGEVLGDLARLGLDALHAPRRGCAH
jgi:hypothetical protein